VWLPFECGWGSCGTCKATLVSGELELLFPSAPAIDGRDERRRRVLTCQTTTAGDVTLRVGRLGPFEERPTVDYVATLTSRQQLSRDIASFTFALPQRAEFRPGQYAIVELGPDLRRCYSMDGLAGDEITFVAKCYEGRPGSTALHALEVGDTLPMSLPYGDMWLRPDQSETILIAGGTGVAPVLSLIRQMAERRWAQPVTVLYGANTPEELVCLDELADSIGKLPAGELVPLVVERKDGWTGRIGLVTTPLAEIATPAHRYYMAGPPPMMEAVMTVLRDSGARLDRIHVDKFG